MQLTTLLFAGLAAASAHRHRRDGGYGVYPALNSSSTVDAAASSPASEVGYPSGTGATTVDAAASSSSSMVYGTGVSTAVVVVSPVPESSVVAPIGTAPFTPSFVLGTGSSVPYPSSAAGTGGVPYPSSSLVATGAAASSVDTVVAPISTGIVAPISTGNGYPTEYFPTITPITELGPDTSTIVSTTIETITWTEGKSSVQVKTKTFTRYITKYVCDSVTVTNPTDFPTTAVVAAATSTPDSTTTIKSTKTHTVVKTVYATTPGAGASETAVAAASSGECAAPVYVTVTAKETVTVTATAGYGASIVDVASSAVDAVTSATATSTAVVYIVPSPASSLAATGPPYGNGTVVYPTGGSTGFLTLSKPVDKPTGTGVGSTEVAPIGTGTGVPSYGGYRH